MGFAFPPLLSSSPSRCNINVSSTAGVFVFMEIVRIEMREIGLRLVHFFETSFGRTIERRILLVRVIDREGAEGWGECTAGEGPFYSEEWVDSAWEAARLFLAPMVLGREVEGAADVGGLMRPP